MLLGCTREVKAACDYYRPINDYDFVVRNGVDSIDCCRYSTVGNEGSFSAFLRALALIRNNPGPALIL
jgi:hypothetical protein